MRLHSLGHTWCSSLQQQTSMVCQVPLGLHAAACHASTEQMHEQPATLQHIPLAATCGCARTHAHIYPLATAVGRVTKLLAMFSTLSTVASCRVRPYTGYEASMCLALWGAAGSTAH